MYPGPTAPDLGVFVRGLEEQLVARGKTEVVDSGVDLERFTVQRAPQGPPHYLCIGSLIQRKNVLRLARAFERLGEGRLTFVGEGPLRAQLDGRPGIELMGALPS